MSKEKFDLGRNRSSDDDVIFIRRIFVIIIAYITGVFLLISRAFYLQVAKAKYYQAKSDTNRIKFNVLPPVRGKIYDRNKKLLADNILTYNLVVNRSKIEDGSLLENFNKLEKIISLTKYDKRRFNNAKHSTSYYGEIIVKENLSYEEINNFLVKAYHFPGFDVRPDYKRYYPYGVYTSHVIGYVQDINEKDLKKLDIKQYKETKKIGRTGIESFYEKMLHGKSGYQQAEISAQGKVVRVLEEVQPVHGEDLHISLDIDLQKAVIDILKDYRGSAVAIEPKTGEVLAMVSMPTYDANWFVDGISQKRYNLLINSKDNPLFNRAIKGNYPPASTIKPLVALAAMHYGVIDTKTKITCKGSYQIPDFEGNKRFHCWKRSGHGRVDMSYSIVQSCDVYYYNMGYKLGIDNLAPYLKQFGLGNKTGLDLFGESKGILPSRKWKKESYGKEWYVGDTINCSIGQGYMITTPIQIAHFTSIIANKGTSYTPHLLKNAKVFKKKVNQSNSIAWDVIQKALFDTVYSDKGTAKGISGMTDFKVSGKTGTAQVFSFNDGKRIDKKELASHLIDNSAFISYAPSEDPKIALVVMLENAGGGSEVAAPISAKILNAYLARKDKDSIKL